MTLRHKVVICCFISQLSGASKCSALLEFLGLVSSNGLRCIYYHICFTERVDRKLLFALKSSI